MCHKRGLWAIKAKNGGASPHHDPKPAVDKPAEKPPKFYSSDDVKKPLLNKLKPILTRLREGYGKESCFLETTLFWLAFGYWPLKESPLMKTIEGVADLKSYFGARFTLKSVMKPHELVF
ncbi:hypothetical protein SADUNF_Sadunf06G0042200 [Salix dunnii]|uniref:Uncharacterized protein n=1 Tax=Salix dunnii TaxID=1413687 RepID=A0A835K314_9ROSI|nr:hypothetical protein SADUNF_Sadunf06G0042200 [Salix dunnii]